MSIMKTSRNYVVGYDADNYLTRRNVIGHSRAVTYINKSGDIFQRLCRLAGFINRKLDRKIFNLFDLGNQFCDLAQHNVDLFHLFNKVSYGRTPWVSTFETCLPRFLSVKGPSFETLSSNGWVRLAIRAMAGNVCKRLIALSECASRIQRDLLTSFQKYEESVSRKLVVMYPPQPALISGMSAKPYIVDGRIGFMMVGEAFFRKGGMEVLETFHELRHEHGDKFRLTIVSSLNIDSYAAGEGEAEQLKAARIIEANKDWIVYFHSLPNQRVLDLMRQSHVGLLPTYADTFGFSVLEFQAAGCPVISTDVRALPEINDERKGWLIPLRRNRLGEAIYSSRNDRELISRTIRERLACNVREILANPPIIFQKGEVSLREIRLRHDPSSFGDGLLSIYKDAIGI
jgi:glycosyltransferase involved in cell wall biosynthesis